MIKIYTDGSSDRDGYGGWAFYVPDPTPGDLPEYLECGGTDDTTNNRMEMHAAIMAMRWALNRGYTEVEIISDSAYLVNCLTDGWWVKWKRKGWVNKNGVERPNREEWQRILGLVERFDHVDWTHIRGHVGIAGNERCDVAAGAARVKARRLAGVGAVASAAPATRSARKQGRPRVGLS